MKVLVARISQGRVFKEKKELASIGKGLALFVGIEKKDTLASLTKMASKVVNLRVFEDEQGKLNYSLKDKNSHQHIIIHSTYFLKQICFPSMKLQHI